MKKFPVTQRQYLAYLNALVDGGEHDMARRRAPKEPLGRGHNDGGLWLLREDGHYALNPAHGDVDGQMDWPVSLIDWHDACAYAAWLAEQSGRPWRLPCELEWEKAARGVDGRYLPWGDFFEHTYACVVDSRDGPPGPTSVHDFPIDESPYGVRGMAGNVRDWCLDRWERDGPEVVDGVLRWVSAPPDDPGFRSVRGGAWTAVAELVRMASRFAAKPDDRFRGQGFRLARSLP